MIKVDTTKDEQLCSKVSTRVVSSCTQMCHVNFPYESVNANIRSNLGINTTLILWRNSVFPRHQLGKEAIDDCGRWMILFFPSINGVFYFGFYPPQLKKVYERR